MAKDSTGIAISNDVQVIREILFGEHLQRILARIEALESALSDLKKDLEAEVSAREQEDQAGEEKLEKTQAKILSDLKQVKRELNGRIESEFVAHRGQHDDLITELATALMRSRQEKTAAQDNQE